MGHRVQLRFLWSLLWVLLPSVALAQSTAQSVVTGYLSTSCPAGQTVCFVQYGAGGGSTVAANQGTAGTNAQAWWVRVGDATNGPAAVKPASTAPLATDPALVVAVSPNSPTPAGTAVIGKVGIDQTTPGATNGTAIVGVNAATALAGAGATGTGSLRDTVAQDTSTIAGSAPGTAGTPSANVVSVQGVAAGTPLPVIGFSSGPVTATATPANSSHAAGTSIGGLFTLAVGRATGTSGRVTNFGWGSAGTSVGQLVVRIWDRNPTNTTCTDNSAFVGSAADDARLIAGSQPFAITPAAPAVTTGDTYSYASIIGVSWEFLTSGNANLYVCAITVATDTADQNKLVRVMLSGPQN